jgi:hypothetical protein
METVRAEAVKHSWEGPNFALLGTAKKKEESESGPRIASSPQVPVHELDVM